MPLKLVLGPANSAKAGEVLGALCRRRAPRRGARRADRRGRAALRRASSRPAGGARRLGGDVRRARARDRAANGLRGAPALDAAARARARACRRRRAAVGAGAIGGRGAGFAAAVGELVAELERSLVTPQRFASALAAWAGDDAARSAYARELGGLYLAYVRELERLGRVDGDLYAWRALDALRAAPARWGTDAVFFYGFDDLHPLRARRGRDARAGRRRLGHRVAHLRGRARGAERAGRDGRRSCARWPPR